MKFDSKVKVSRVILCGVMTGMLSGCATQQPSLADQLKAEQMSTLRLNGETVLSVVGVPINSYCERHRWPSKASLNAGAKTVSTDAVRHVKYLGVHKNDYFVQFDLLNEYMPNIKPVTWQVMITPPRDNVVGKGQTSIYSMCTFDPRLQAICLPPLQLKLHNCSSRSVA